LGVDCERWRNEESEMKEEKRPKRKERDEERKR